MPRPKPLSAIEAKNTLAARFGGRADRLRQLNTRFGIRPHRVFLVWTSWTGTERGEGEEIEVKRLEILPTPKVIDLSAQALTGVAAGVLPMGSVRVEEISTSLSYDVLTGRAYPEAHEDHIPQPVSFFWEIREDGRSDPQPLRMKFRVSAPPFLMASRVQWKTVLERISEDNSRIGESRAGNDEGLPTF